MAEDGSRQGQGRELSGRETILVQNAVAVVKPRDHTGLQELCALANSVKSFLGPVKSHKFIFDQDTNECTLTCSSFRLLESLDLTSAVGQLFNETVQVHHKIYRTGTTTLFFLVGAWSSAVLDCLRQGVPVAVIASVMLDGLNSCIEQVQTLQQPVYSVHHTNDCVNKKTDTWDENRSDSQGVHNGAQFEQYSKSSVKYINHVPQYWGHKEHSNTKACRNRLTHSRYFTDHERSCLQDKGVRSNELLCKTLGHLAKALCHGNPEIMNLVENAFNRLYENAAEMYGSKVFSPSSQFHICCFPGLSEEHSKASFGYTTLVSLESATVAKFFENKSLHILLLDGELTENYRHLGFNHSANLRVVSSIGSGGDTILDEPWTNTTCRTLIEAKIDLVLVRGDVCPLLMSLCVQRNILVVPQVKQNVLQAFSESTGAEPVVYVTQINQYCIGSGAFVSLYTSGTKVIETSQRIAVNIMAPKLNLITVTLCHRLPSKLQVMEDQFWTCSYRLYHALNNQKVFYGGGAVELLCLNHLKELETIQDYAGEKESFFSVLSQMTMRDIHYKPFILRCLAKGWSKYISILLCNTTEFSSELDAMTFIQNELQNISCCYSPSEYIINEYTKKITVGPCFTSGVLPVYDNVIPKVEAWRSAIHLVLLVLQTDAEIISAFDAHRKLLKADISNGEYLFL